MRKLISKIVIAGLLSTSVYASPALLNSDESEKRQGSSSGSAAKRQKLGATAKASLDVYIKSEEGIEASKPLLLSIDTIKSTLPKFNPESGDTNCLECSTSFVRWVKTGVLCPAKKDAKGENFLSYAHFGYLLQSNNAEHIAPASVVLELSDADQFFEYIDVDKRLITFTPTPINNLKNYLLNLPMEEATEGLYQAGMIYLHYRPEAEVADTLHDSHFINFYISQPYESERTIWLIDAQTRQFQSVEKFLSLYAHLYEDRTYVWNINTRQNLIPSAVIKIEEVTPPALTPSEQREKDFLLASFNKILDELDQGLIYPYTDRFIQGVCESPLTTEQEKEYARFVLAVMRSIHRTEIIDDIKAVEIFQNLLSNTMFSEVKKTSAAIHLSQILVDNPRILNDGQHVAQELKKSLGNELLEPTIRVLCSHYLSMLHYKGIITSVINDEQTAQYCMLNINCLTLDQNMKNDAVLCIYNMVKAKRTNIMSLNEAEQLVAQTIGRQINTNPVAVNTQHTPKSASVPANDASPWPNVDAKYRSKKQAPKVATTHSASAIKQTPKLPPLPSMVSKIPAPAVKNPVNIKLPSPSVPVKAVRAQVEKAVPQESLKQAQPYFSLLNPNAVLPNDARALLALTTNMSLSQIHIAQVKFKLAQMRVQYKTHDIDDIAARKYLGQLLKMDHLQKEDFKAIGDLLKELCNRM